MNKIIEKHWHLISLSKNKDAFKEKPLIAFRRNKNISDKLVNAECNPMTNPKTYCITPCATPWKCQFCSTCKKDNRIKSSVTGRTYKGPEKYTCKTRNIIYVITCKKCSKQYVGETYRTFKERMTEHIQYVKHKKLERTTGAHFNSPGHSITDMQFQVAYILYTTPIKDDPNR